MVKRRVGELLGVCMVQWDTEEQHSLMGLEHRQDDSPGSEVVLRFERRQVHGARMVRPDTEQEWPAMEFESGQYLGEDTVLQRLSVKVEERQYLMGDTVLQRIEKAGPSIVLGEPEYAGEAVVGIAFRMEMVMGLGKVSRLEVVTFEPEDDLDQCIGASPPHIDHHQGPEARLDTAGAQDDLPVGLEFL